jgi:hypothetical protein
MRFECFDAKGLRVCSHEGLAHVAATDVLSISAADGKLWIGTKKRLYRVSR